MTVSGAPARDADPIQSDVGIGRAAILGLVSAASTIGLSIVRTKISAHYLGPAGVGRIAEVLQLVTLAMVPVGLFVGPALISQVAAGRADHKEQRVERLASTAIAGTLALGAVGTLVAVGSATFGLFHGWANAGWLTLAASIAAVATAVAAVPGQVLTGLGRLKPATLLSVVMGAAAATSVSVGTVVGALSGNLLGSAVGGVVCVPLAWALARRGARELSWVPSLVVEWRAMAMMAKLGLSALIASLAMQGSLSAIRFELNVHLGPAANGLFQAAWALGGAYFGIASTSIGGFAFPRYAAARTPMALASEVDATVAFIVRVLPPILLVAMVFRRMAVDLLYTSEFRQAADVLGVIIAGDLARGISWAQAGPLLYRARIRAFLLVESCAAALLVVGVFVLVPRFGLLGPAYAYAGMYVAYLLLTALVLRASCGVPLRPARLVATPIATLGMVGVMIAVDRFAFARWGAVAVAIVWWFLAGSARATYERLRTLYLRVLGKGPNQ